MIQHWADQVAERLIKTYSDREEFVLAAGISPSGTIHIGNFRDIITSEAVYRALVEKGKKAKLLFSWDDYDRFRKVPSNVSKEFEKHLGKPYTAVPDPFGKSTSYAEHFEKEFEINLPVLGIKPELRYQTKLYKAGTYNQAIIEAMNKRVQIAEILAEFKSQDVSEDEIKNYYPLTVYCEQCEKDDGTKIKSYDQEKTSVTYACSCGHEARVNISEKCIGKLVWKVDWAMRWRHEGVCFEPGGKDHSTPGGSYDVSKRIVKEVFNAEPPIYQPYDFIGLRGLASKMSGSTGINISPGDLLKIYEPLLLRWLFLRVHPTRPFDFCFDSEIIRQYDELDKQKRKYLKGELNEVKKRELDLAKVNKTDTFKADDVSFRQIASVGQMTQGNKSEIRRVFADLKIEYNQESLERRLELSQNWVNTYAPELKVTLRNTPNQKYYTGLSDDEKKEIQKFFFGFEKNWNLEDLTTFVYGIPKNPDLSMEELKEKQKRFFTNIYQLLVDNNTGPRLPTLIMAIGKEKVKKLSVV